MRMISNFFKTEFDKLKPMTFKEKRQYIWEYYKLAFGIILMLGLLGYGLLDAWVINPPKDDLLTVAWLADNESETKLSEMSAVLIPRIISDPETETVSVLNFSTTGEMQYDMAKSQQFAAMLGAGELEIFIMNGKEAVGEVALAEYVSPVDDLMSALKTSDPALYEKIAPTLVHEDYVAPPSEFESETLTASGVYAIPIKDAPYIKRQAYYSEDLYLCVSITAMPEDYPAIIEALRIFFEE